MAPLALYPVLTCQSLHIVMGNTYDIETCYTYDMTLDERHIMSSQTSPRGPQLTPPKAPIDPLVSLLRSDPTWFAETEQGLLTPTPREILERYSQLGDMAPVIYLFASRQRDDWSSTEEILRGIVRLRPNHTRPEQGEAIAANLRLISAAAAVMAGLYEAYDVELAGEGE